MLWTLLPELARFVTALEQLQQELLTLLKAKRRAFDEFNAEEMVRLSDQESALTSRLQAMVGRRTELLEQARLGGLEVGSLQELSGAIGKHIGDARVRAALDTLQTRLHRSRERTAELQRESWVHWIISHRCYNHYTELLELIAHGGQQAPTYGDRNPTARGGALLDAAA